MAFQTLSGLAGIGTSRTPRPGQRVDDGVDDRGGRADGAGLADALDAEGLVGDGVTVCPVVIGGTSLAAGTRYSASVDVVRLPSVSYTASS
jgi:hypothetical protein